MGLAAQNELVSWCFDPSQPQRITSRLNINFTLSSSYSFHKSYHKPCFFLAYLYSVGTQHRNLHPTGWPILSCGPTQEPVLATAKTGKIRKDFRKNASEWTGRVELSKEEIPGSKHSMYGYVIYWPTPGFKGRTFKLCVLARWDFNFCVRSSPPQGQNNKCITYQCCKHSLFDIGHRSCVLTSPMDPDPRGQW